MSVPGLSRDQRRQLVALLTALLVLLVASAGTVPTHAQSAAALTLEKSVDRDTLSPGQRVTYRLGVGCSSGTAMCEGATLTDQVPAPLVVESVESATSATVEQDGNRVTVYFTETRADGTTGMTAGSTADVLITVSLPEGTPPELNGQSLLNSAELSARNAAAVRAEARLTLDVPVSLGAEVTKRWGVPSVGTGSTETIPLHLTGIANTSNIGASSLELREPSGGTNPFDLVEIIGLAGVTLPQGADEAQVIALTAGGEVPGPWSANPQLPAGVDPATITGLRVIFADASASGGIVAGGAGGSVELHTRLRSGVGERRVDNEVSVVAHTPQGESAPVTAAASFTVDPPSYAVEATKSVQPGWVIQGDEAVVSIGARNASNQWFDTMSLTETAASFFGPGVDFTGFRQTSWPAGADTATLTVGGTTYPLMNDGGTVRWPAPVPEDVSGFVLEFSGAFPPGATIGARFAVTGSAPGGYWNTVEATGAGGGNDAVHHQATAYLGIGERRVVFGANKYFGDNPGATPTIEGVPGETVTAILQGWVGERHGPVHQIVQEDVFNAELSAALTATAVRVLDAREAQTVVVERLAQGTWSTIPGDAGTYPLGAGTEGIRIRYLADPAGSGFGYEHVRAAIDFEVTAELEDGLTLSNGLVVGPGADDAGVSDESRGELTVDKHPRLHVTKLWYPAHVTVSPDEPNPRSMLQLVARNTSAFAVDRLEVSEPGGDTNAFELIDITRLSVRLHGNAAGQPRPEDAALTLYLADGRTSRFAGAGALNPSRESWADVVGFDFALVSPSGQATIPRGAVVEVAVDTELRRQVRSDGTDIEQALAALEPPSVIRNSADAVIGRGADTASGSASATLTVDTAEPADITVDAVKTLTPSSGTILQPGARPTEVAVQLALAPGQAAPDRLVLEDVDPTFWNAFDLHGWTDASLLYWAPSGAVELVPEYLVGAAFTADEGELAVSGGEWVPSGPFDVTGDHLPQDFGAGLPDGVEPGAVQGVRITIATTNGEPLPGGVWNGVTGRSDYSLSLAVTSRPVLRSGELNGNPGVPNPGESTAATVVNTMTGTAARLGSQAVDTDDASFTVLPGQTAAEVSKTAGGQDTTTTTAGGLVSYTLEVTNTGTAPIIDPVITDLLPADADGPQLLLFEEGTVGYSVSPKAASITTDPQKVTLVVDDAPSQPAVTVTFPDGSALMPGETYTVTLPLIVRPGHPAASGLVNTLEVTSAAPGSRWTDTAVVNVVTGQAYQSRKLVREVTPEGAGPTGTVTAHGAADGATCTDDGDGFHRYPCVVQTRPGGHAEWQLSVTNTGNVDTQRIEILDILPWVGDAYVAPSLGSVQRGTEWQPTVVSIADPVVPAGTEVTTEYLLGDPAECVPGGPSSDPWRGCDAPGQWTDQQPADLAAVRAMRWVFEFDGGLRPTEGVTVSVVTESGDAWPEGAVHPPEAWNSFAYQTTAVVDGRADHRVQEPNKAGISFPKVEPASVIVAKEWVIDGEPPVADGAQPDGWDAHLTLSGPDGASATDQDWSVPREGYLAGDGVTIDETVSGLPPLCELESVDLSLHGGVPVPLPDAVTVTLEPGENRYTITNTVSCRAELTLLKHVDGADPESGFVPAAWDLTATPAGTSTALAPVTVTGDAAVSPANTFAVRPDHTYTLTEVLAEGSAALAYRHVAVERYVGEDPQRPDHAAAGDWVGVADPSAVAVSRGEHAIVRFVNAPVQAVVLPLTGGLGPAAYVALGSLVLAVALCAGVAHHLHSRRTQPQHHLRPRPTGGERNGDTNE
ncbi:conserved repeat domain-containing protein [Georgenia satyanarayanai]|uniref:Conserved repeat domain-containing protein n=1 Tax=Georgenia satyanarayanai TaxID=860221 RepID=A0A2Y9C7Q3_9MICO|nr:hypothetical protein [Georgenia satyanarayanai]PYF96797.1 putative repeat protein (TIGR01451 family) [Georgenia satyanarayanai]SSA46393.1 conserved repeat domain-containing protein [Georgenia satyanarayanai]